EAYDSDTARPENAMSLPKGSSLYANLKISGRQIRLLTILSTTPEISCRVEVAEFEDELSFNALSYVWGDPTVTEAILVNGHRIQVTTNLASALGYAPHHLSESKHATSMKLWVDSICINQKDIAEKNRQVSLMKDIYSQSGIVLCWLGSPSDPIHAAMNAVESVAHERHIRDADAVYYKHQDELLDCFEQLRSHLKKLHVTYNNLLWLKQHPWLYEVKEVVGESPTGPAQPLFDVSY
ncbi:heterokaryon incompatibility protein-domain-containing protein, partial [Fusarium solani]